MMIGPTCTKALENNIELPPWYLSTKQKESASVMVLPTNSSDAQVRPMYIEKIIT